MPKRTLAKQIDAFELELSLVETLIDQLRETSFDDPSFGKTLEQLHVHRATMRNNYNVIRPALFQRLH